MSIADKIVAHLRKAGVDWRGPATVRRTYAGYHQKSAGAWTWLLQGETSNVFSNNVGGYYPASLCAKKGAIVSREMHGITVDPSDEIIKAFHAKGKR